MQFFNKNWELPKQLATVFEIKFKNVPCKKQFNYWYRQRKKIQRIPKNFNKALVNF